MSPIGFMVPATDGGHAVVCTSCGNERSGVRIYRVNVYPYSQSCACCGRKLVKPQTPSWPELFTGTPA